MVKKTELRLAPAEGRAVVDPARGDLLPAEGRVVKRTPYWLRRLEDKDVVETKDGSIAAVKGQAK